MEAQDITDIQPLSKVPRLMEFTVFKDGVDIGDEGSMEMEQLTSMIKDYANVLVLHNGERLTRRHFQLEDGRNTIQLFTSSFNLRIRIFVNGEVHTLRVDGMDMVLSLLSFFSKKLENLIKCADFDHDVVVIFEDREIQLPDDEKVISLYWKYGSTIPRFHFTSLITVEYVLLDHAVRLRKEKIHLPVRSRVNDLLQKINFNYKGVVCKCECRGEKIDENIPLFPDYYKHRISITFVHNVDKRLEQYKNLPKASTYASNSRLSQFDERQEELCSMGNPICDHRNGSKTRYFDDVSIYYSGFDDFVEQCEKIAVGKEDCMKVLSFCSEMAKTYPKENARQQVAANFFRSYVHPRFVQSEPPSPEADIYLGRTCLIEVKNEEGCTGTQAFREVTRYYVEKLSACTDPAFLVELVGPNMTIFGAVHGRYVFIDRLVPTLWLVPQPKRPLEMIHIAKVMKAFKNAIHVLHSRLNKHELDDHKDSGEACPRFPEFREAGNDVIEYTGYLAPHVFTAVLGGSKTVVKFTDSYGKDVHDFLHEHELAPKIHCFGKSGRFQVVVMDMVEGRPIDEWLEDHADKENVAKIESQCVKILKLLKQEGYVHGDLRDVNMLVDGQKRVNVIDFDWAGKERQARYPFFLNHIGLQWPEGASDGMPILHEHDEYWVSKLFPKKLNIT